MTFSFLWLSFLYYLRKLRVHFQISLPEQSVVQTETSGICVLSCYIKILHISPFAYFTLKVSLLILLWKSVLNLYMSHWTRLVVWNLIIDTTKASTRPLEALGMWLLGEMLRVFWTAKMINEECQIMKQGFNFSYEKNCQHLSSLSYEQAHKHIMYVEWAVLQKYYHNGESPLCASFLSNDKGSSLKQS